jgi:hypothetical protein
VLLDFRIENKFGVTAPDSNPKILIFAVNDLPHTSHADQLVRTCRDVFDQSMRLFRVSHSASVGMKARKIAEKGKEGKKDEGGMEQPGMSDIEGKATRVGASKRG